MMASEPPKIMTTKEEYADVAHPMTKHFIERHVRIVVITDALTKHSDLAAGINQSPRDLALRIADQLIERKLIEFTDPETGVEGATLHVVTPSDYSSEADNYAKRQKAEAVTKARFGMMWDIQTKIRSYRAVVDDAKSTLEEKIGARKIIDIFEGLLKGWGFENLEDEIKHWGEVSGMSPPEKMDPRHLSKTFKFDDTA